MKMTQIKSGNSNQIITEQEITDSKLCRKLEKWRPL